VQVCNEKLLGEIIMEVSRASLKRSRRAVRSEAWRVKRKVCTIVTFFCCSLCIIQGWHNKEIVLL